MGLFSEDLGYITGISAITMQSCNVYQSAEYIGKGKEATLPHICLEALFGTF